jgi:alkylated DNA nucleotide flippase Atl1
MDQRFCSLCAAALRPPTRRQPRHEAGVAASSGVYELEDIIEFLNAKQVRATYGAVAELVGGIPRGIGDRLTRLYSRSPEASWVVNAETGMPTGYEAHERHPALLSSPDIISNGAELERRLARWKKS